MKQYYQNKNRYQQNAGPDYSELSSSDVLHPILVSPTDTWQALDEAAAKLANPEQRAKSNILKFLNNDFSVRFTSNFSLLRQDLRKLFSFRLNGKSDYVVYTLPDDKRVAFRFANHNAYGNNFKVDNADINISVYIRYEHYKVEKSDIRYTEYEIDPEYFDSNRETCVRALANATLAMLNGEDFYLPETIATEHIYPDDYESNHENSNYTQNNTMKNNNKALYESIMKDVAKVVKKKLNESNITYYTNDDESNDRHNIQRRTKDFDSGYLIRKMEGLLNHFERRSPEWIAVSEMAQAFMELYSSQNNIWNCIKALHNADCKQNNDLRALLRSNEQYRKNLNYINHVLNIKDD